MTFFSDLTPYSYLLENGAAPDGRVLNIGWLDGSREYSQGAVPEGFLEALVNLCRSPQMKTRGVHFCNVCPPLPSDELRARWNELTTFNVPDGGSIFVGNGEIRVTGPSGLVYASPTLILHYIADHGYRPADDFIMGVLNSLDRR